MVWPLIWSAMLKVRYVPVGQLLRVMTMSLVDFKMNALGSLFLLELMTEFIFESFLTLVNFMDWNWSFCPIATLEFVLLYCKLNKNKKQI